MITLETDMGRARAYLAAPAGGRSGPGVVVLHAWWGLTPVFTQFCDRLAAQGFVALAPDLYAGRTAATIAEAEALLQRRELPAEQAAVEAAVGELHRHPAVAHPRLGVVGFSLGASWALELAALRPAAIAAVVLYYGTGVADFTATRADYLGHFADPDEWEPDQAVRALEADIRAAGRAITFHRYPGVGHWFAEPNQPAYQPAAAEQAWARTQAFLRAALAPSGRSEHGPSPRRGSSARSARALGRPASFVW